MPSEKPRSNLRALKQRQRDLARAEYLRHPDSSISDVSKATGVGVRTVARAREALVREGLLPPGRNTETGAELAALTHAVERRPIEQVTRPESDQPSEGEPETEDGANDPPPTKQTASAARPSAGTLDGEALRKMNSMLDELADEDDEVTLKRMLRLFKRFSADPTLLPDTRMAASQGWMKLRDMARSKDLGPGTPLTLTQAIARATDFCRAAGAKVMVPAFYAAFDLGEVPNEGQLPTVNSQAPPGAAGTPQAP